jgi:hypothetical protein
LRPENTQNSNYCIKQALTLSVYHTVIVVPEVIHNLFTETRTRILRIGIIGIATGDE